jgi:hypothetical protein
MELRIAWPGGAVCRVGRGRPNFTAHIAYGLRYFMRPHTAFVASYRFHHISNGNRLERNPGVNAHVIQLGVSLLRKTPTAP